MVTFIILIFITQNYSFLSFDGIFHAKIIFKVVIILWKPILSILIYFDNVGTKMQNGLNTPVMIPVMRIRIKTFKGNSKKCSAMFALRID